MSITLVAIWILLRDFTLMLLASVGLGLLTVGLVCLAAEWQYYLDDVKKWLRRKRACDINKRQSVK